MILMFSLFFWQDRLGGRLLLLGFGWKERDRWSGEWVGGTAWKCYLDVCM